MKKVVITILSLVLMIGTMSAQSRKDRKAAKAERKAARIAEVDSLVNARSFVFKARQANPQGGRNIDLSTNPNFVKFHPDTIESYMPFFGRAYNIGYGGDGGLKFEGKALNYEVTKLKKNKGYRVTAQVNENSDNFQITISVGPEGYSTLQINSNQRNPISYFGEIEAHSEEKK